MLRNILLFVLVFFSAGAVSESMSISVKPKGKLTGTVSLNIHDNDTVTLLAYEKPGKITENKVEISRDEIAGLKMLAKQALAELINMEDFSAIPEQGKSIAVTLTRQKVTKSVTTRRHTPNIIRLEKRVNSYLKKP